MKYAVFRLGTWKWDVVVCVGPYQGQFLVEARKLGYPEIETSDGAMGRTLFASDRVAMVWVKSLRHRPELVHEALHVVTEVLLARGLRLDASSEEAFCYTQEGLVRAIWDCKEWKAVSRKKRK
jgi:hypothetical protein